MLKLAVSSIAFSAPTIVTPAWLTALTLRDIALRRSVHVNLSAGVVLQGWAQSQSRGISQAELLKTGFKLYQESKVNLYADNSSCVT